jgi:hypothetical protein
MRSESRHIFDKNYRVGEEKSAYVGESMVKVKDYYENTTAADMLSATETFRLPLPPLMYTTINAGTAARVIGTTSRDGKTYRVVEVADQMANALRFLLNDDGSFQGSAINTMGAQMGFDYTPNPSSAKLIAKTFTKIDTTKGAHNFEIVYSGTTKDSLNLLYREYSPEDLVRPAFTQNLTYARDSSSVRFRDMQLRITSADNEKIAFTVLADGMAQ